LVVGQVEAGLTEQGVGACELTHAEGEAHHHPNQAGVERRHTMERGAETLARTAHEVRRHLSNLAKTKWLSRVKVGNVEQLRYG
jgi:hypothetical protein